VDHQRSVTLLYLLAGLAGGLLVRSAGLQVVTYESLNDPTLLGVVSLTTLLGVVGGIATFFGLSRNAKATEFTESAISEMSRVTWPSRDETTHNTGIVIGAALGFGVLMFVYDSIWATIVKQALYSGASK